MYLNKILWRLVNCPSCNILHNIYLPELFHTKYIICSCTTEFPLSLSEEEIEDIKYRLDLVEDASFYKKQLNITLEKIEKVYNESCI